MKKVTYSQVGDDYSTKDPIKKLAQTAAAQTGNNLRKHGFLEIGDTRGESAYVWRQGNVFMASVVEGLGTKNLVADEARIITGKTHYDVIGHDTVATIINDLISVGAKPLVIHAYWAVESNDWLLDEKRMADFIGGWQSACNIAGVSWGGGETPTLKGIVEKGTVDLGGSAVGIIEKSANLITSKNLQSGDRILLLKSNGINSNGLSLARAVAKKLPKGYAQKMESGENYGQGLLRKTNIYADLIADIQNSGVKIHYLSNITGHGLRKIMRAKQNFTYYIEEIIEPQEIFSFIQKHSGLSDYEIYGTYNMGMDYAIFLSPGDVEKTLDLVKKCGFVGIDAGYVEIGERQVIIKPKNIIFKSETLDLR